MALSAAWAIGHRRTVVQLSAPILTAAAGVALLSEALSVRLMLVEPAVAHGRGRAGHGLRS